MFVKPSPEEIDRRRKQNFLLISESAKKAYREDINKKSRERYAQRKAEFIAWATKYPDLHKRQKEARAAELKAIRDSKKVPMTDAQLAIKKQRAATSAKLWSKKNARRMLDYAKHLRKTNLEFKIKGNLRTRMNNAIRAFKTQKGGRAFDLLGCEIPFFIKYIESKFYDDMRWENHGRYWHLDHIIPCVAFNLTLVEDQKRCFHYTNFQPLKAEDNLRKNSMGIRRKKTIAFFDKSKEEAK